MEFVGGRVNDFYLALELVPGIPESVPQPTMTRGVELPDPGWAVFMVKRIAKWDALKFISSPGIQGGNASAGGLSRKGEEPSRGAYIKDRFSSERISADILVEATTNVPITLDRRAVRQIEAVIKIAVS